MFQYIEDQYQVSVSKRSFSSGWAYYSRIDHNYCRIPDTALHKGNVYYWARDYSLPSEAVGACLRAPPIESPETAMRDLQQITPNSFQVI